MATEAVYGEVRSDFYSGFPDWGAPFPGSHDDLTYSGFLFLLSERGGPR